MSFTVFYVTHPDEIQAHVLVEKLLSEKLIACGNIFPITSMYEWKGVIENTSEYVTLLKTRTDLEKEVESYILQYHPYEVPCIMRYIVEANDSYEKWIQETTKTKR